MASVHGAWYLVSVRSGWFGAALRGTGAEAIVELCLVLALAQDRLDQTVLDRLARAVDDGPELYGVDWDWLVARAEQLRAEAPLFFDARGRIAEGLLRGGHAEQALAFARRLLEGGPLEDAEVILADMAARLGLEPPAPGAPPLPGLARARFDDPENPSEVPFHVALAHADRDERRLLLFKLAAARACLRELGPGSSVTDLGRHIPVGHGLFRADALIDAPDGRYTCRFLAPGEALHPAEHRLISAMARDLGFGQRLLVAHLGRIAPPDAALLDALAPEVMRRVDLSRGTT